MTKLAETYIHLKIDATDVFKRQIEGYLYELAQYASYQIFNQETQIDFRFEEGSWRTWVAVAGAIYIGIGQYGSFRSGVGYFLKDARKFSNIVIERFVDKENLNQDTIFRTERRLGVPGKLDRLFKRIDRLQKYVPPDGSNYPSTQLYSKSEKTLLDKELLKIKNDIHTIYNLLDHDQDASLFINSLSGKIQDYNFEPPELKLKFFPEPESAGVLKDYISDSPVSTIPEISSTALAYPLNDFEITEKDEMENLKKLIKSNKFDIGIAY